MLYAIICTDKPDSATLRQTTRPDHLDYIKGLGRRVKAAGPFIDESGQPTGSLLIVETGTRSEAEALAGLDPYAKAGLFADVLIRRWNWLINNPEA